jgi:hypothetical protein
MEVFLSVIITMLESMEMRKKYGGKGEECMQISGKKPDTKRSL